MNVCILLYLISYKAKQPPTKLLCALAKYKTRSGNLSTLIQNTQRQYDFFLFFFNDP